MSRGMDWEKTATERRMKKRGTESVRESGLGIIRRSEDRRRMDKVVERIASWAKEPSIEDAVEAARHVPDAKLDGGTRAQWDTWLRGILDAWAD